MDKKREIQGIILFIILIMSGLLLINLLFVRPNIYSDQQNTQNEIYIITNNVRSQLNLTIKATGLLSNQTEYNLDFNFPTILNKTNSQAMLDENYLLIYPGVEIKDINNISCKIFYKESVEICKVSWAGSGVGIGNPIFINVKENVESIRLEFQCHTCSYRNVLLALHQADLYNVKVNFSLSNNIIEGIDPSQINDVIKTRLIERKANKVSLQLEDDSIKRSIIPIFLIVRNTSFDSLETVIIVVIGGLIGVLFELIIKLRMKE